MLKRTKIPDSCWQKKNEEEVFFSLYRKCFESIRLMAMTSNLDFELAAWRHAYG